MGMVIRWTPAAAADLQAINDYLKSIIHVTARRRFAGSTRRFVT